MKRLTKLTILSTIAGAALLAIGSPAFASSDITESYSDILGMVNEDRPTTRKKAAVKKPVATKATTNQTAKLPEVTQIAQLEQPEPAKPKKQKKKRDLGPLGE